MDRDQVFQKYPHDAQEKVEVPMHSHTNGQLTYVGSGTMHLITPQAAWVIPQQRVLWIRRATPFRALPWPVRQLEDHGPALVWRVSPQTVSVLQTSALLVAALEALPVAREPIAPARLRLLVEVIQLELQSAKRESFGVTLPRTARFGALVDTLLEHPEDGRGIDAWAKELGMSRRTFTRTFIAETGSPFGKWRRALLLGKALDLLSAGASVSETALELGYSSPSAFVEAFRKRFGTPPGQFFKSVQG